MVDSLGKIVKRTESTSNHYGNKTTEERCVIQLLISSEVALQKICSYCRKCAQNMQKICSYCRKYAGIAENMQLLQKICSYCRKYAAIAENLQKICRYCRKCAAIAEDLQLLQKICRYCRKCAHTLFANWTQVPLVKN